MVSISAAALSFADLGFAQQYFGKFHKSGFRLPEEALLNPLHQMRSEDFSQFVNATFQIAHPTDGNLELTLIKVIHNQPAPGDSKTGSSSGECFTLVFSGLRTTALEQGQYTAMQEKIGLFDLFVVPGTRSKNYRHYEAVFNRL